MVIKTLSGMLHLGLLVAMTCQVLKAGVLLHYYPYTVVVIFDECVRSRLGSFPTGYRTGGFGMDWYICDKWFVTSTLL